MAKNYHVICIPLYFWEFYKIKTPSQLLSFATVLSRMFRFEKVEALDNDEIKNISILGSHFVWKTQIYGVKEITKLLDKNIIDNLHIKHILITDYGFEIISSDPEIISSNDIHYVNLESEIAKITFKNCHPEDFSFFEYPAIVASLKIITCDTADEVEKLSIDKRLEKVTEYFYLNEDNTFNFISEPWNKISMPDLIVTLKPKIIREEFGGIAGQLGFYVTLVHTVGKIYSISESIHSACANLVITSWNIDEICHNLESSFSFPKRIVLNNEIDFYNLFREFKELVQPLTLLSDSTGDTIQLIMKEYGTYIGPSIEYSFNVLHDSETKKFFSESDLIVNAFMNNLKMLGENLTEFLTKFQSTSNSWREIYRSKINHSQMMIALIALLIAIIGLILTKG